jgi:hypothetical protein
MELVLLISNLLGILVVAFLLLWNKKYIGSYLAKKGENLAQREDIAHITELVEETRQKFSLEMESLKSSLAVDAGTQLSMKTEERNAIINYFKALEVWSENVRDFGVPILDRDGSVIEAKRKEDKGVFTQFLEQQAVFEFYIDDLEILRTATNFVFFVHSEFAMTQTQYLGDMQVLGIQMGLLQQRLRQEKTDSDDLTPRARSIIDEHGQLAAEAKRLISLQDERLSAKRDEYAKEKWKLRNLLNARLRALSAVEYQQRKKKPG